MPSYPQLRHHKDLLPRDPALPDRLPDPLLHRPPAIPQRSVEMSVSNFQRFQDGSLDRAFGVDFRVDLEGAEAARGDADGTVFEAEGGGREHCAGASRSGARAK